jgi:phytoene synthase
MNHKKNLLIAKHSKSFFWASFFLPKDIFTKCSAVYDFCRTIDDIADSNKNLNIKKKNFITFKKKFFQHKNSIKVIDRFKVLLQKENISEHIIQDLFDGIQTDLKTKVIIKNQKKLYIYSYQVAGTVGLIIAKILGIKNKEDFQGAVKLGVAMQFTNIARDVVEDAKNNRFYINDNFKSLKQIIQMADKLYDESMSSIVNISPRYRLAILVARRVYRQIGYEILKKKDMKTYLISGKIYIKNYQKLFQTILATLDFIKSIFFKTKNINKNKVNLFKYININERI